MMEWQDRRPGRPDRYLDWEAQNRPWSGGRAGCEHWCAALIQVAPGPAAKPAENLKRLKRALQARPKGAPSKERVTIRMEAWERHHLDRTIKALESGKAETPGADDVALQFFIYLPEDLAYRDGGYAHGAYYRIRLVGPPIDAAAFNSPARGQAAEFQGLTLASAEGAVAVGIIDDGIAFAHERFRLPSGKAEAGGERTRIAAIWLQETETAMPGSGIGFGRRLGAEEIDGYFVLSAASTGRVDDAEVYRRAGMHDFSGGRYPATALRRAHGTHVMDLACGYDPRDGAEREEAARRPILAVQLPDAVTADTSGVSMGCYVLQGLRQIMLWADDFRAADGSGEPVALPLVVNFSYGICAGPKDGTHVLEREIGRLVEHRNRTTPTAVVLPSGNTYRDRLTARMRLDAGGRDHIDWMILPDDRTPSFVEIWFNLPDGADDCPIALTLSPPVGAAGPGAMPARGEGKVLLRDGKPVGAVYYDIPERVDSRRKGRIFLAVNPSQSWDADAPLAPSGRWRIGLANGGAVGLDLHLHIQRDDTPSGHRLRGRQSHFDRPEAHDRDLATGSYDALSPSGPITHEATLSAIGTGAHVVLVGAALDGDTLGPASYTTSGPAPSRPGPDVSAIAEDGHAIRGILAAGTMSGSVVAMRGTSVAAPQIARRLAGNGVSLEALKEHCGTEPDVRLGARTVRRDRPKHIPHRKHRAG